MIDSKPDNLDSINVLQAGWRQRFQTKRGKLWIPHLMKLIVKLQRQRWKKVQQVRKGQCITQHGLNHMFLVYCHGKLQRCEILILLTEDG